MLIVGIGALIGSLTFGYFITSLGSKRALLFLTIPDILFWLLIYFGNSFYHILIAKFLGGWAATGAHGGAILFVTVKLIYGIYEIYKNLTFNLII